MALDEGNQRKMKQKWRIQSDGCFVLWPRIDIRDRLENTDKREDDAKLFVMKVRYNFSYAQKVKFGDERAECKIKPHTVDLDINCAL